jgi:flagellar protein FliS
MEGRNVLMPSNPYTAYLEATVLTAEPVELIRILCRAAVDSVRDARAHLAAGDIPGRAKAISKSVGILHELSLSLHYDKGPAIARNLVELYDYMQRRLLAGHLDQSDAPLAEVACLLDTLSDAWNQIDPQAGAKHHETLPVRQPTSLVIANV